MSSAGRCGSLVRSRYLPSRVPSALIAFASIRSRPPGVVRRYLFRPGLVEMTPRSSARLVALSLSLSLINQVREPGLSGSRGARARRPLPSAPGAPLIIRSITSPSVRANASSTAEGRGPGWPAGQAGELEQRAGEHPTSRRSGRRAVGGKFAVQRNPAGEPPAGGQVPAQRRRLGAAGAAHAALTAATRSGRGRSQAAGEGDCLRGDERGAALEL